MYVPVMLNRHSALDAEQHLLIIRRLRVRPAMTPYDVFSGCLAARYNHSMTEKLTLVYYFQYLISIFDNIYSASGQYYLRFGGGGCAVVYQCS